MLNKIFYKGVDNVVYNFCFFIIDLFKIEIEVKYNTKNFYKLGISNHVTEFDVFLLYAFFSNENFKYKWVSDERFKNYPVLGPWATFNETIFISRKDGTGSKSIKKNTKQSDNVFIFPEGTLYYQKTINISNDTCKKLAIQPYNKVLCPKINGFYTLLNILKPDYITDITLDYIFDDPNILKKSKEAMTIANMYKNPPKKIIIIVDRIKCNNKVDINEIFRKKDISLL